MTKKELARSLWDMSFGDDTRFTDLYFKKRYTDENTVAIYSGEKMISVLQLLPYPFLWKNTEINSAYISGACTHNEFRNKGAMHQLLNDSLNKLAQENTPICTLIPAEDWLFSYYAKSGFETLFYNTHYSFDVTDHSNSSDIVISSTSDLTDEAYQYLDRKTRERETVILHPTADISVVMDDLKQLGSVLFIARKIKKIVGIAFAYFDNENKAVVLYELLTDDCNIKQEIFQTATKHFNTTKLTAIAPAYHNVEKKPFGMLRIVLAYPILEIYAKANPQYSKIFTLQDDIIVENNGTYAIENGSVVFSNEANEAHKKISINELALLLFKDSNAYMSLMLD